MSTEELYNMIVHLAPKSEMQLFSLDTLLEFVLDFVGEKEINRFQDMTSILNWLNSEDTLWNRQRYAIASGNKPTYETAKSQTFRPGDIITIPISTANNMKFNDMESVQAYLNHQSASNQSNDDCEEVDVTTFDYTPAWNHYHHVTQPIPKTTKIHNRVLVEKQPTASSSTNYKNNGAKNNNEMEKPGELDLGETFFECKLCDKKYKQKSSLNRHEKGNHSKKKSPAGSNDISDPTASIPDPIPPKKPRLNQTNHNTTTKNNNYNIQKVIPLSLNESIST